jgi:hypothetical protein
VGRVWLRVNWRTGATTEHCPRRRAHRYTDHADYEQLEARIRSLHAEGLIDEAIATTLYAAFLGTPSNRRVHVGYSG